MRRNSSPFKWRHYAPDVILLCVRWYCRYSLSYRDVEEMMRPRLKMSGPSYRIDETYVRVGKEWKYLHRAVDSAGNTIEFTLSAQRDVSAAQRSFKKLTRVDHRRLPFTVVTDKHASYPGIWTCSGLARSPSAPAGR